MATVAELFTHLQSLPEYHGITEPPELEEENAAGDRCYRISVRMVTDQKVSYIHIYYWVKDEGLPTEEAWVWDREPKTIEEYLAT